MNAGDGQVLSQRARSADTEGTEVGKGKAEFLDRIKRMNRIGEGCPKRGGMEMLTRHADGEVGVADGIAA